MIQLITRRTRKGDSRQPWHTPVFTWKLSDSCAAWATAAHVLVGTSDEGDQLLWYSVVSQKCLSIYTIEHLLVVDEVNVEGRVPFKRLLNYDP